MGPLFDDGSGLISYFEEYRDKLNMAERLLG